MILVAAHHFPLSHHNKSCVSPLQVACLSRLNRVLHLAPLNFSLAERAAREADLDFKGGKGGAKELRRECRCLPKCRGQKIYQTEATVTGKRCPKEVKAIC